MASRYKTKLPSNWVVSHIELSVPVPRARGGATDVEVQHAQVVNTDAAALPANSSAPALPVLDRLEPTQPRFERPPPLSLAQAVHKPPQVRSRYSSKYPPTWTMEQERLESEAADTIGARFVSRDGPEIDDGASSGEGEASPEPPDYTAQYESTPNPPFHIGAPALGEDPADHSSTVRPTRRSQYPPAAHSRTSAAQRQARSRRRDSNRYQITPDSVSSARSTNSPQSRGEASATAPSISPCYSTLGT
jgi:hypothetical protein